MQVYQCKRCMGLGTVEFTKEYGGPVCNNCAGIGYMTEKVILPTIASILDYPNAYMGGPTKGSLVKARKILDWLASEGITFPPE